MIRLVVLLCLFVADLRRRQSVLGVGEGLSLIEIGLDAREDVAALHLVAIAMKHGDDFSGNGALDVDFHFGLDVPHLGHLDLDVGDLRLTGLDRELRRLVAVALGLHGHEGDHDRKHKAYAGKDRPFFSTLGWTHRAPRMFWLPAITFEGRKGFSSLPVTALRAAPSARPADPLSR